MFQDRYQNIILILTLLLCVFGNILFGTWDSLFLFNSQGDTLSYLEASRRLAFHGQVHPVRPLGIAFLHAIPYFFGATEKWVIWSLILLQNIVWIVSILLFYRTSFILLNRKMAFYLTIFFLFSFGYFLLPSIILSEVWTIFFVVLLLNQLIKYHQYKAFSYLISLSSILILLTLIRPGFYYPALLFLGYLILRIIFKYRNWSPNYLILIFSLALLLLNNSLIYKNHGQFKPSYIDDLTLYVYLGAYGHTEIQNTSTARVQRERREEIKNLDHSAIHSLALEDIKFQLAYHPRVIIKYLIRNIYLNSTTGTIVMFKLKENSKLNPVFYTIFYWLSQIQNTIFVILSICLPCILWIKKKSMDILWVTLTLLPWYILFTSGISYLQGDRFHVVFYPIILIQIGYCYFLYSKKKIT